LSNVLVEVAVEDEVAVVGRGGIDEGRLVVVLLTVVLPVPVDDEPVALAVAEVLTAEMENGALSA